MYFLQQWIEIGFSCLSYYDIFSNLPNDKAGAASGFIVPSIPQENYGLVTGLPASSKYGNCSISPVTSI
jgi:hypothetical protein